MAHSEYALSMESATPIHQGSLLDNVTTLLERRFPERTTMIGRTWDNIKLLGPQLDNLGRVGEAIAEGGLGLGVKTLFTIIGEINVRRTSREIIRRHEHPKHSIAKQFNKNRERWEARSRLRMFGKMCSDDVIDTYFGENSSEIKKLIAAEQRPLRIDGVELTDSGFVELDEKAIRKIMDTKIGDIKVSTMLQQEIDADPYLTEKYAQYNISESRAYAVRTMRHYEDRGARLAIASLSAEARRQFRRDFVPAAIITTAPLAVATHLFEYFIPSSVVSSFGADTANRLEDKRNEARRLAFAALAEEYDDVRTGTNLYIAEQKARVLPTTLIKQS